MAISELARKVFLTYFVTHIPATMLIDARRQHHLRVVPTFARNALPWHISTNNDVLMAHQPAWLRSLVMCELVFQLPFFFVAISALRRRDEGAKGWLLAYGAHTAVAVYDPAGARVLRTLPGHDAPVTVVRWIPDAHAPGRWLVSGDAAGAVILWHRRTTPRVLRTPGPSRTPTDARRGSIPSRTGGASWRN